MARKRRRQSNLEDAGIDYAEPEKTELIIDTSDLGQSISEGQESYEPEYKVKKVGTTEHDRADQEMSGRHQFSAGDAYSKKVIYADRPAYEKRSNNLLRESWSYHSLFPSLRTFLPLIVFPLAAVAINFFGYKLGPKLFAGLWGFWDIAWMIALLFFMLEATKARVSHGTKDVLIHLTILILLAFLNGWNEAVVLPVFMLYLGAHLLMHMIDFHLERNSNRAATLALYGSAFVFMELLAAVAFFAPSLATI